MKRLLSALLLTAVLLAIGWVVQERVLGIGGQETPRPAPTPAAELRALEVTGSVERQRSAGAAWAPVATGDVLDPADTLRTSADARAVLAIGDGALVRIAPESQVSVSEIHARASKIRLEEGRMSGEVLTEGGRLEVAFRDSDAVVVATEEGRFDVVNAGGGFVAVSSSSGGVQVTAAERTVDVGPGEQSVVLPQLPPSTPRPVEAAIFLKLGRPPATVQREAQTLVEGRTTPGTLVRVGEVHALAGTDGRFSVTVPLREGRNALTVEALAADGRGASASLPAITVDSKPLDVTGTVKWK